MQGKFIVFEGVEGSGKTTQIQRTQAWLTESGILDRLRQQGYLSSILLTREPGGTLLGKTLRQLLLDTSHSIQDRTELLLYAADRAQHVEACLRPALAQGAFILCDRYTDSTVAYQGYGRGFDQTLIHQLNQISTGGLQSDLTLWLALDAETGLNRAKQRAAQDCMEQDRIEQAHLSFHQRVEQGFSELAQAYPQRIVRVDAALEEAKVAEQIQGILRGKFAEWYGGEGDEH